jgi:hypothetical protein
MTMFENIRSRKRHGQAQVEYRACRKEVEEKFAAGYSSTMIYEELAAAGRLTVSYSAFCDYVRGEGRRIHNRRPRASQAHQLDNRGSILKPAAKSENHKGVDLKQPESSRGPQVTSQATRNNSNRPKVRK